MNPWDLKVSFIYLLFKLSVAFGYQNTIKSVPLGSVKQIKYAFRHGGMGVTWLVNATLCIKDIMLKIPEAIIRCIVRTVVQDGATGFPLDMFSILQMRNIYFIF